MSIVIQLIDTDAPSGNFAHWVLYGDGNNPGNHQLTGAGSSQFHEGVNDFGTVGYRGPCPPPGSTHRYHLIVMAVSFPMGPGTGGGELPAKFSRSQLEAAIKSSKGPVENRGEIVATYSR